MSDVIKLIGKAYIIPEPDENNPNCYLCIDSEETKGIIFGCFNKQDIANAHAAAETLNLWAGKAGIVVVQ